MPILDRFRIDDQVALVTGAGRGIGRATAIALAECGADVALAARSEDQLEAVAQEIRELGRRALVFPCNAAKTENLQAFASRAHEEFGRIDVVVNNVGGSMPKPFLDTTEKDFSGAFHFNVTTAFALSKAATPYMLESGGAIVNISSSIGQMTGRGFAAYGTAKAAMTHFTKLLAEDLAPKIRVNAIAVGSTATSALETVLTNDVVRTAMVEATPLKRLGEPEDIALGALYLASPASAFVTGSVMEIHGGIRTANLEMGIADL
ncbi:MAG: SDR family oxidoreductase [Deltaproteobacteria bacterium]|jgi:7-alpha-hydroxysteroid dehydrogenase|nr:SDR family oxidoreductase [Deltaproteobacteria bacterium]